MVSGLVFMLIDYNVNLVAADLSELLADKLATTETGKCLKSCLMMKFNTMDGSGKMNKEGSMTIVKIITKDNAQIMEIAEKVLDACVGLEVSTDK